MNQETIAQQINAMRWRLQKLYQDASESSPPPLDLLPRAFMEIGTASEELQVALEELRQQNQELVSAREQVEAQRQHYQELFNFAPNAYLLSDANGKILEANQGAAVLLNFSQQLLAGKSLSNFVAVDRRMFRNQLERVRTQGSVHEWEVSLIPYRCEPVNIQVTVAAVPEKLGQGLTFNWLLREVTNSRRTQVNPEDDDLYSIQSRPKNNYSRGEIISLETQAVWLVCNGLVKLSTMAENGVEVLVGLAGAGMIFGSSLTNLQIYQAIALSKDVQLVSIPLAEIEASPRLAMNIFPKINRRLQQAEALLAISGHRRVSERLYRLLLLLKQEIGQPVAEGTRLKVRLTHEDLANACSTTRVTITRTLNKLEQQEKIAFDGQHHIILLENTFSTKKA